MHLTYACRRRELHQQCSTDKASNSNYHLFLIDSRRIPGPLGEALGCNLQCARTAAECSGLQIARGVVRGCSKRRQHSNTDVEPLLNDPKVRFGPGPSWCRGLEVSGPAAALWLLS